MTATVLDSSAVIAWARREQGGDKVAATFGSAVVPVPNWAEVLQIAQQKIGWAFATTSRRLRTAGVGVAPVTEDDAEIAAKLGRAPTNRDLSLADRFCLAVAERLDVPAYTSDQAWATADTRAEVVMIR